MRKFKINRDYYDDGIKLYKKGSVEFDSGVTVLVGCNGIGKTTLLNEIKGQLSKGDIPCIFFDNLRDGGSNARSEAAFLNDFEFVAQTMCSSEGENIALNVGRFAQKIGKFLRDNKEKDEIWILLDAVDSGLSIDAVVDIKEGLFKTILNHYPDTSIYIIVSANEYEMAYGEKCYDVANCRYVTIKSYEKYKSVILKSREIKDNRYE